MQRALGDINVSAYFLPQLFYIFRIQKDVLMVPPLQAIQNLSLFTKVTLNHSLIGPCFTFFRFHIHAQAVTTLPSSSKLYMLTISKYLHKSDQNVMRKQSRYMSRLLNQVKSFLNVAESTDNICYLYNFYC